MRPLILACPACAQPWEWEREAFARAGASERACPSCGHVLGLADGVLALEDPARLAAASDDYPAELAASDARLEEQHWWHASRDAVIRGVLRPWQRRRGRLGRALEVGCGTGRVLTTLEREGWDVVGLDPQPAGLAVARTRTHAPLLLGRAERAPLAEPVDLAALCDVLEHADEAALLAPVRAALAPDGALLLTVPARPSLWSLEDVAVGHRRRYTLASLASTLRAQGFRPLVLRPFHAWLTPLAWRAARRAGPPPARAEALRRFVAERAPPGPRARRVFGALCAVENAVGRRVRLPFGSHLAALAERA